MKNHSYHLHTPLCAKFAPNSVDVARYAAFIWHKSPTNCAAHLAERKIGVIYYDCTNFYFEIKQAEDDKQYGISKANRPLPIVEMGLFTDMYGTPVAFSISP